jgi:hypothetical protein
MFIRALAAVLFLLILPGPGGAGDLAIAPRSPFAVQFGDVSTFYNVLGVYVLPGQEIPITAYAPLSIEEYSLAAHGGVVTRTAPNRWTWKAPDHTGLYPLEIQRVGGLSGMTLNAFVMEPFAHLHKGRLNGYLIGSYPRPGSKHATAYQPPRGFIEVTRSTENTLISPHFKLGEFVTKQGGGYPRYVVLRELLPLKLEAILDEAHRRGIEARTFTNMSGYRTPAYNRGLGNVQLSRHQFGDASDIFVDDAPRDGRMDDLNRDGKMNVDDSRALAQIVEWMSVRQGNESLTGGLGVYESNPAHGPFVHVDARGFVAHWSGEGVTPDGHAPEPEPVTSESVIRSNTNPAMPIAIPSPRLEATPGP